jgi:molybdenum cofactor cytidylyltransferase
MQAAAVILAAGASTRFGSPKQLARIGGRTMLEMVAATARDAGLGPVIAVVPPGFAVPAAVVPVINVDPAAGISRSLHLGMDAVPPDIEAAVILLGDEPTLAVDAIRAVLAAAGPETNVVASRVGERLGPPVLLHRSSFGLALASQGDAGLGPLLRRLTDLVTVEMDEPPVDVDTPADLARLDPPGR